MKIKIDKYSFDASAKKVFFLDYEEIYLDRVLLITNVTDNIIVYNFADTTKGGSVSENALTLEYDTTAMEDSDKLLIFYEEADVIESGDRLTLTKDKTVGELLEEILSELKETNIHLSTLTGMEISEKEQ